MRLSRNTLFIIIALWLASAAIFHLIGVFDPTLRPGYPRWRHALFVGLSVVAIFLVLRRPLIAIPFFAIATIQQLYSHGSNLWETWQEQLPVNWTDIAIVIIIPLIFLLVTLVHVGGSL